MNTEALKKKFEGAMFEIYRRAKTEAGYTATHFLGLIHNRGGLDAAKYLINAKEQSDGYTALWDAKRLDLTVEAMVVEQVRWHPLFLPEEIEKARIRLKNNEYEFK